MTTLQTALTVATAATASGTLAAGKHTPVDATSGALTMTLPTPSTVGARLRVEKIDASANAVTISGTIRGGASTIPLTSQYEALELFAESLTSWRPAGKHTTKAALDAAYVATVAAPTGTASVDTAAIQSAIDAATPGGRVLLRAGTYVVNKLTIKTGVQLAGQGRTATVVQLAAGVNDNLIESTNFATLTGTDTTATPYNFGISDLTLDGNKSGQTVGTSHGLALYAYGYRLENFVVRNCRSLGIWSEWGSASPYLGPDGMEAFVTNYKIHDCDAGGVTHQGPHDSQWINGFIVKNSGTVGGTYGLNIPQDGRSNGSVFTNLHVYGGGYDYGLRNASSGLEFLGCQFEGAQVGETLILASQNKMTECKWFSGGVAPTTVKGIVIGDGTHTNINNLRISGKVENVGGAVLDLTNSGGDHTIDLHAQYFGGGVVPSPAVIGSFDNNSTIQLQVVNPAGTATADSVTRFPTSVTVQGNVNTVSGSFVGTLNASNTVSYPLASNTAKATRAETLMRTIGLSNGSLVAGQPFFAYFTPDQTITVTTINTVKQGTAAVGTTLARMALYTVDGSNNLTCIARTASDATLWTGADGINTRNIADDGAATPNAITQVTLTRGVRYALGVLVVGASTTPQIVRANLGQNAIAFMTPVLATVGPTSQTDFVTSYTSAQTSGTAVMLYGYAA